MLKIVWLQANFYIWEFLTTLRDNIPIQPFYGNSILFHPSNIQTTEDDKVILLKYIWNPFFDFARDQWASSFSSRSFPYTIRIFLL